MTLTRPGIDRDFDRSRSGVLSKSFSLNVRPFRRIGIHLRVKRSSPFSFPSPSGELVELGSRRARSRRVAFKELKKSRKGQLKPHELKQLSRKMGERLPRPFSFRRIHYIERQSAGTVTPWNHANTLILAFTLTQERSESEAMATPAQNQKTNSTLAIPASTIAKMEQLQTEYAPRKWKR